MKVNQLVWKNESWEGIEKLQISAPQLCLLFGTREVIEGSNDFQIKLKKRFPNSDIVVSSTAGNIFGEELLDDVIVANVIQFDHTEVDCRIIKFDGKEGFELGQEMAGLVDLENTAYCLSLSCAGINAHTLLKGFNEKVKGKVPLSGGVAGDNYNFEKTIVGLNDSIGEGQIVLISLKGDRLHTNHGSKGGWDVFGPERVVTKSDGNVLYEIDGKPALELYKTYLGDKSSELPTSALHFPIAFVDPVTGEYIVRGVQNVDNGANSMILYGDLEEGCTIQLMKANFDRVIQGAEDSAVQSQLDHLGEADFSLLISCVARRLVLDQLVEEELEEVKSVLGENTVIGGFYSYSELSPVVGDNACHLHNQTMTITSFYER